MFDFKICFSGVVASPAFEVGSQLGFQEDDEIAANGGIVHEFTSTFEQYKVIGTLLHSDGLPGDTLIILDRAKRRCGRAIMDEGPIALVSSVYTAINASEYV